MQAFRSATRPRVWALCLQHASRVSDESNLEEHLGSPLLQSPGGVLNCPDRRLAKQIEKSERPMAPPNSSFVCMHLGPGPAFLCGGPCLQSESKKLKVSSTEGRPEPFSGDE